ncbi:INO80 complex subunit B [Pelobates cultripes]|uniref:INO80 complex subunit B n=1 Tax=Pelobates cultripes TaxID=61616 RepID=A0AAD1SCU8_PELCU|nr:INO80 complex subunit B [Pelobates cultripes]
MSTNWNRKAAIMEGADEEDDISSHGNHKKKHKKHKKHKKRHHQDGVGLALFADDTPKLQHRHPSISPKTPHKHPENSPKPQLKLKIKLGGQILGTKSVPTFTVIPELSESPSPVMVVDDDEEPLEGVPIEQYRAWLDEDSNLDPLPSPVGMPEPEQDEETRWLDALERGELDVNGDLKRETDETLLTARQKALLQKQQAQSLPIFPPVMFPPRQELSEEMLVKREEKARKRRLQAAKKAEESKKQTIERLTKTSKSRGAKPPRERRGRQPPCPTIRYQHTAEAIMISYPLAVPGPIPAEPRVALPAPTLCRVPGCGNPKKYCCSRTLAPLCSLECYRNNLLGFSLNTAAPAGVTEIKVCMQQSEERDL